MVEPTTEPFNPKGLKTSEEWNALFEKRSSMFIMDADGWDRSPDGRMRSRHEEKISRGEFSRRAMMSTCAPLSEKM